ncbi:hypothetical protein AbraIFM66951_004168 [Aspergillus brasiliensis]|uniref:NmrA-like domain-containing protein n=2 Tax=Aspergillus brasiliensis TaxID=319629 RepID=A0A1L9U5V0_ASPBC|nr:hypothetical protein ASPBRDRAFT_48090 [Aspergillus brasiliensis CBS 101740]GKZ27114.1 hypothetical protein AbraCBS73388_003754 [Aspergillus brasiliensis]GKZ50802.1 hypothetical protein AbraIFM66951_004168 [Aspergillus brasiliensis]
MAIDFENDIVLLTCASGKQCSHLIPLLYRRWRRLRLAVHSVQSERALKSRYPETEVVRGDMTQPEYRDQIMAGVTVVVYIAPAFHPQEAELGYAMIEAARQEAQKGTFQHFIYSSVLHPQLRKLMNHDCKRYVEEYLIESGLNYTTLQPSHFLDMFPVETLLHQADPVFRASFNPDTAFSFTVLQDLAEAFLKVIEEREKHYLAEYMICSTRPISYRDVVATLSHVADTRIGVVTQEFYEAAEQLQSLVSTDAGGCHRTTRDGVHRLQLYYDFYGIKGNPNVLEWLIGRKPTTVDQHFRKRVIQQKD